MATSVKLPTIAEVVGRNVRRLRLERNWSQDLLARECRRWGLEWTQATLSLFESGRRQIELGELILIGFIFGDAGFASLIEGSGRANLAGGTTGDLNAIRRMVSGLDYSPDGFESARIDRESKALVEAVAALRDEYRRLWPGARPKQLVEAERAASGTAEIKAAYRLGIRPQVLSVAAYGLWGRSLTAERDARVGPDANHASRGHVSRQLIAEIENRLQEVQ